MDKKAKSEEEIAKIKRQFMDKVCRNCIYFVADHKIGMSLEGGHCDYLGVTGHSRIKNTPSEQMYKSCPMKRTSKEAPRVQRPKKPMTINKSGRTKKTHPALAHNGRKTKLGKIEVCRTNGEVVGIFETVKEAAAITDVPVRKVYKLLAGETKNNNTGYSFFKCGQERTEDAEK